jgi:thiol-disulfide isomerase/thioredoxin
MKCVVRPFSLLVITLLLQACGGAEPSGAMAENQSTASSVESSTKNSTTTNSATTETVQPTLAADPVAAAAATYQDLQGHPVEISHYAGKKVFINYWATWCAPCIKEIPSINRAADALAAENYVFLLASDEKLDTIKDFLLDRNFTGNFIKLNSYAGAKGINVMPTSVLYDEQGNLVKTWEGSFEWDGADMLEQLRHPQ